jgi:two-component system sensor histidine kinase BaeS
LVEQVLPTLGEHAVHVRVCDDPPEVCVDRVRVDQVVTNLLINAAKYSPDGSPIDVSIRRLDAGLCIDVADRGMGIARDEIPRLFDRFYQARRARKMKTGVGLGLYISKGLVEAQGGKIWVDTKVGTGSTFHVWFPAAAESGTA